MSGAGSITGALVSLLLPEALIILAGAAFGGVAGGLIAHLSSGISRSDAKELGDLIRANEAAIMIVGKDEMGGQVKDALTRSKSSWEGEMEVDRAAFESELAKAVTEMEEK